MYGKNKFLKEQCAVSPVMDVILMIAITVILAASIAAFATGLVGNSMSTIESVVLP